MIKKILISLIVVGAVVGFFLWGKYQAISSPNVPADLQNDMVEIPTNSTFSEVVNILLENDQLIDTVSFREVAELMNYKKTTMRAGRYKIESGWSNRTLITHLRGGKQATVKVVLNTGRFVEDIASKAAKTIESDSTDLAQLFHTQSVIKSKGA